MRTSKEYRQTAWSAIKPVLPIMLLIALVASLPQLVFLFIQAGCGLTPPMDTDLLLSDPDALWRLTAPSCRRARGSLIRC